MNKYIIEMRNFNNPGKELDHLLLPSDIYSLIINKEKLNLQKYLIENSELLYQFVGFNSKLKHSKSLSSERKCGCFYEIPWKTKYAEDYNLEKTYLLFNQQLIVHDHMIKYWYPNSDISHLRYISSIALEIIQDLKKYNYYQENNLNYLFIFNKPWSIWKNVLELNNYLENLKQ